MIYTHVVTKFLMGGADADAFETISLHLPGKNPVIIV